MKHNRSLFAACSLRPLARQPWWVGVLLALAAFIALDQLAALPASAWGQLLASVATVLVPLLCLVSAARSAWRQRMAALAWQPTRAPESTVPLHAPTPPTQSAQPDFEDTVPPCPLCNSGMVRRTVQGGADNGKAYWRCVNHPGCEGRREAE